MKKFLYLFSCLLLAMCLFSCGTSETETTATSDGNGKGGSESVSNEDSTDDLASLFVQIGFTQEEAAEMEQIFDVIGIHAGRNIRLMPWGDGIDVMQSFAFDPYDSIHLQVNCTVENRELCFVELAGLADYKPVYKVNYFGKGKVSEQKTKETVTLFYRWVDETNYHQPIEDSYRVLVDWENQELTEFVAGAME